MRIARSARPFHWIIIAASVIPCLGNARTATAQTLLFDFTGQASGVLGGGEFSDAFFHFAMAGDAGDRFTFMPGIHVLPGMPVTFTVAGVSGTLDDPAYAFVNQGRLAIGFGTYPNADLIVLGRQAEAASYDLLSAFGPVTDVPGVFSQFRSVPTSAGSLTMTEGKRATFEARTASAVLPEPSTILLLATGLLAVAGIGRRAKDREQADV